MERTQAIEESLALINSANIAMVGTVGDDGYPQIKAMIKCLNEGLQTVWFSTNTSSHRMTHFQRDPRICVYFVDFAEWRGLQLTGDVEILTDGESRQRLWHPGDEKYYPQGVMDPDYSVLRFTAKRGNYYHALSNLTFDIP
jgi:general stress protein 26